MLNNVILLESLNKFYSVPYNRDKLINILNDHDSISLRSIDWFITNYSKKNNTYYIVYHDENNIPTFDESGNYKSNMNVFHSYKSQLKAYSKKRFDPFCRWERITIPFMEKHMETTIGQLNFFKWAIEYKVIDYIEENYQQIENDMNSRNTSSKKRDTLENGENSKTRKKREELSVSAVKCIKKEKVKIVVKFDL